MWITNLRSHALVAEHIERGRLQLHGWVYKLETGEVFAYDSESGQFEPVAERKITGQVGSELPRISPTL